MDVAPEAAMVKEVARLLRPPAGIALHPVNAEALRTCLEEDQLEIEDRLQRFGAIAFGVLRCFATAR